MSVEDDEEVFLPSALEEEEHVSFKIKKSPKKKAIIISCCILLAVGLLVLLVLIGIGIAVGVIFTNLRAEEGTLAPPTNSSGTPATTPTGTPATTPTGTPTPPPDLEWWKTAVIYQCYPRSYQDSDGDGNGDLTGIIRRIGYLSDLGIKALWLNPIFTSPQRDNGYDVSNYTDVDPLFGDMSQLMNLIRELHSRGMHLLLDFVPNHTSDEHPWFVESRSNKTNSKRDWYVWADGKGNATPPTNWISVFGGSAWTYDNTTGQYYLHQFSEFQPDLNYNNPEVRTAFEDVLRFWLERGVDGFRIDAISHLLEDTLLRDEPVNENHSPDCGEDCYDYLTHTYTRDYRGIHNITRGWRRVLDSFSQSTPRFMVGEVYDPVDIVMSYYGTSDQPEFHFPFNFFLLGNEDWSGNNVDRIVHLWLDNMPSGEWPNWVLGNHDNHRIASKGGNYYLARALAVLLFTLPGTPTTYYGDEILMTDVNVPEDQRQDMYGDRDKERTPMQWSNETHAGFTTGNPWLPLASNYSTVNVQLEQMDNSSILTLYKNLIAMRSTYPAFKNVDNFMPVVVTSEVYAYLRRASPDSVVFLVVINFAQDTVTANVTSSAVAVPENAQVYLSSNNDRSGTMNLRNLSLRSGEAIIFNWNPSTF